MSLIKWEPFGEMDRFFNDDFFSTFPAVSKLGTDLAVDVYEKDGKIIAQMNLPGVKPEEVNVEVEDGYLTISGARSEEKENKDKNYYSKEIRRGSFQRVVRLPGEVDSEGTTAEYNDGVLTVTLARVPEKETKKVKVQVKK